MGLPVDPRLPATRGIQWPTRLTQRLTELLREWARTINPWVGPSWENRPVYLLGLYADEVTSYPEYDFISYPGTPIFRGTTIDAQRYVQMNGTCQLPQAMKTGSILRPHAHWAKTGADALGDGVTWEARYARLLLGDHLEDWGSWTVGTLVKGSYTGSPCHCVTSFGDFDASGMGASDIIAIAIRRDTNDSYVGSCWLFDFDFNIQWGQIGTENKQEWR
jgi:hypothetical protein